jgi:hypothetical protein
MERPKQPRNRVEEEMTTRPEPLEPAGEQAEDLAPEDERIDDDDDDEDDTLGRPVRLER